MADDGDLREGSAEWLAQRIAEKVGTAEPAAEVTQPPESEPEAPVEEDVPAVDEQEFVPPLPDDEPGSAEEAADQAEAELGGDASEAEVAQAREEAAQEFYAGRYKTRDEVEKALKEQISLIGRQGQELGELKKQVAEQAEQAEVAEQPQELDRNAWNEWAEQTVEEGAGADGAVAALKEGGYAGYEIYLSKWLISEEPEQRAAAMLFNNAMMMRIAEDQRQPLEQEAPDPGTEVLAARQIAAAKRPDFEQMQPYMQRALEAMDMEQREWLSSLAESGVEGQVRALDQLYLEAKLLSGDRKGAAQQKADAETRTSSDRAKLAASDTPSVASHARTPLPAAEQVALEYGDARRRIWGTPERAPKA